MSYLALFFPCAAHDASLVVIGLFSLSLICRERNRNDHTILCMVLYNFLLLLHISTCHFPKDLTFV